MTTTIMPPPTQEPTGFHDQPAEQVYERLDTGPKGLSQAEAERRLAEQGPNRLKPPQKQSAVVRFLKQFHNILIYILIVAAVVTALLGHWIDTGVILAVVVINAIIGYVQEGKAERALEAIRHMLSLEAVVMRDGQRRTVPAEEIVPGDVVVLESGDKVPADLRLARVKDLGIDEAILTGESVPVDKATEPVESDASLGDRFCIAFSGTLVTSGRGEGVVVATGERTEIGKVSEMIAQVQQVTTPLLEQIGQFGRVLSAVILAIATITFLVGWLVWGGDITDNFLAAVGIAVAAIPEGLPAILTITLAIGVQRMAGRNAIIRHLPAVDTLGSVTVICSDKTGTLTRNEMTVRAVVVGERVYETTGVGYSPEGAYEHQGQVVAVDNGEAAELRDLLHAALLCNDAAVYHRDDGQWVLQGDPTEGALVAAALKAGLSAEDEAKHWPRTDVIPFESEHKFMATLHHDHEGHGVIYVKGAPERVLEMCAHEVTAGGQTQALDAGAWARSAESLAEQGQRVLAVARHEAHDQQQALNFDDVESGLTLLGLVGIIDPPRDEAIKAVGQCREAGIRVKMITGDHVTTARAIGLQLGIGGEDKPAITGRELDEIDDETLRERVREVDVYARVNPAHKLRLVEAIQGRDQVVAMTGDGVNDAPALKRADVGVAMGQKGTEAAKEASDMVLADDNFASIAHAVEEGRTVYNNLQKAILFILPTNGAQALAIMGAIFMGLELPITPVQILWVNMITTVTMALALAFEPPEPGVMRRRPRKPREPILSRFFLWRIAFVSVLMWIFVYGAFVTIFGYFGEERFGEDYLMLARTLAVNTLVVCEAFYLFNTRRILDPVVGFRGLLGSRYVLYAIGLVAAMQLLWTYLPLSNTLFDTVAVPWWMWGSLILAGVIVYVVVELEKLVIRHLPERYRPTM